MPYVSAGGEPAVKAWIVGDMTAALVVASGLGLWLTSDDARMSGSQQVGSRP
jgi:hypothetical protein